MQPEAEMYTVHKVRAGGLAQEERVSNVCVCDTTVVEHLRLGYMGVDIKQRTGKQ